MDQGIRAIKTSTRVSTPMTAIAMFRERKREREERKRARSQSRFDKGFSSDRNTGEKTSP